MKHSGPWVTIFQPNPNAQLRLFCFPHAGAGASIFRAWASLLPDDVEVCGIQYPGREARSNEPLCRSLTGMLDELTPALLPYLEKPFAFAGYSMGSLVSFELTRSLIKKKARKPEHIFFGAAKAPHIRDEHQIHQLPGREFLIELIKLKGIAPDVLRQADLVRYLLPIVRADFTICETYQYQSGAPLECPVSVYGGSKDPRVRQQDLEAWSYHASMYFSATIFPGDHFFLRTAQSSLLKAMLKELQPLLNAVVLHR